MADGFLAYQNYLAMKRHFQVDSFDYFKYHGKTSAKRESFNKRNDRSIFERLAKRKDYKTLMLSNFIAGDIWVGDLLEENAEKVHKEWKARKGAMSYHFKKDLYSLERDDFNAKDNTSNLLVKYRRKEISLETLVLLNYFLKVNKYYDRRIKETILWPTIKRQIEKYQVFLEKILSDKTKNNIKIIIREYLDETELIC